MNLGCMIGRHDWMPNKNGMRMCARCGKFDMYFSVSGLARKAIDVDNAKEEYLAEISGGAQE